MDWGKDTELREIERNNDLLLYPYDAKWWRRSSIMITCFHDLGLRTLWILCCTFCWYQEVCKSHSLLSPRRKSRSRLADCTIFVLHKISGAAPLFELHLTYLIHCPMVGTPNFSSFPQVANSEILKMLSI